ncbi:unnamed protein product [Mytilus edulis]|uniref:Uncharacterized protein n=1 Tax=Mytilus edulis TaxID=6550 RepID=A0A8S3Q4V3_MYTED|nr:unnamed protein product [Mytilus edulis]
MYKEQFPGSDPTTDITHLRDGSLIVDYFVYIEFPEDNYSVTEEVLKEATKTGITTRVDHNPTWLFKNMDLEAIRITDKTNTDSGDLLARRHRHECPSNRKGKIYCSVFNPSGDEEIQKNVIYCFDQNGNDIWQFNDEVLRCVTGMATDRYDNVFLTNGRKLIIVSPDGNYHKLLYHPIPSPSSIFFEDENESLVITSKAEGPTILCGIYKPY